MHHRPPGPAAATRPRLVRPSLVVILAEGMVHVLVNGEFVIDDGRFTDARPGRVLQRGRP